MGQGYSRMSVVNALCPSSVLRTSRVSSCVFHLRPVAKNERASAATPNNNSTGRLNVVSGLSLYWLDGLAAKEAVP